MLRNVASQKWRVYAWDTTTGAAKTGDQANITAYITNDDGTPASTDDTNPTQASATNEPGYYDFDLTQAETNASKVSLSPKSSTASISVIACPPVAYTVPQYSSVQAIDSNGRADVSRVAGAAQTAGDLAALIATLTSYVDAEVAAIKAKTDNLPSDPADASDINAAFGTVNATLAAIASYIDTEVTAIKAKTDNLPANTATTLGLLATSAQLVKVLAAVYDSVARSGNTLTLSNGATQEIGTNGRTTTEP